MFGLQKIKEPSCVVCHEPMAAVELEDVPEAAKREFARLNRWAPLTAGGWWFCKDCGIHVHQPTIKAVQAYHK